VAQSTGGMSAKNGVVEYCITQATPLAAWVNISGSANSVTVSGGNRTTGDAYTADGDTAVITSGKREAMEITFRGLYTESAATPQFFEDLAARYEAGTGVALRWSPTAYDTSGQKRFSTSDTALTAGGSLGVITAWNYPSLDFASGDPIMCEFTVRCSAILTLDVT